MIRSRMSEYSRKPDKQSELIERCSPGPRVALRARRMAERRDNRTDGNYAPT